MLHLMGDLYYIDGNGNKVKVRCIQGNPERMASRLVADNTLELPLISISEVVTNNSDERRRYSHVMISEKSWDPNTRRATRVVSMAPRPVNITYQISIWTKYKTDMDMIRAAIFTMFNPDLDVRTKFSDYNRAFLLEERDMGSSTSNDGEDRVIQKAVTVQLETYIPSPKFRVTSTGEINANVFEVTVDGKTVEYPLDVGNLPTDHTIVASSTPVSQSISLISAEIDLTVSGIFNQANTSVFLGEVEVSGSLLNLVLDEVANLGTIPVSGTLLELVMDEILNLGTVEVSGSLDITLDSGTELAVVPVSGSVATIVLDDTLDLGTVPVSGSIGDLALEDAINLGSVSWSGTLGDDILDNRMFFLVTEGASSSPDF
jgi:hypothetical protein